MVAQGANAEFGRSSGGFVNVITKSGTNEMHGTLHYFGKDGALSSDAEHASLRLEPDFRQHQFGATLGGPIVKDKLFYFVAYDQQAYKETKQKTRPSNAAFDSLRTYLATAFGGVLAQDFGPIERTNDAQVAMVKIDWRPNEKHNASLKYNYTNSKQENGTFDVDTWAQKLERDREGLVERRQRQPRVTPHQQHRQRVPLPARARRPAAALRRTTDPRTEPAVLRHRHGLRQRVSASACRSSFR